MLLHLCVVVSCHICLNFIFIFICLVCFTFMLVPFVFILTSISCVAFSLLLFGHSCYLVAAAERTVAASSSLGLISYAAFTVFTSCSITKSISHKATENNTFYMAFMSLVMFSGLSKLSHFPLNLKIQTLNFIKHSKLQIFDLLLQCICTMYQFCSCLINF